MAQILAGIASVQEGRLQDGAPGEGALDAGRVDLAAGLALQIFVPADMIRVGVGVIDGRKLPAVGVQVLADLAPRVLVAAAVNEADPGVVKLHQADLGGALDIVTVGIRDLDQFVHKINLLSKQTMLLPGGRGTSGGSLDIPPVPSGGR